MQPALTSDADAWAFFLDKLRGRVALLRRSSAEQAVELLVAVVSAYAYALAANPMLIDFQVRAYREGLAVRDEPLNRWVHNQLGYAFISSSGHGRATGTTAPVGVSPAEIVEVPDTGPQVPGTERVAALVHLLAEEGQWAAASLSMTLELAQSAIQAASPGSRPRTWTRWRGIVTGEASIPAFERQRAERRSLTLGDRLTDAEGALRRTYARLETDGLVFGAALILSNLHAALVSRTSHAAATSVMEAALTMDEPARPWREAFAAVRAAIDGGHEAAIEEVADRCRDSVHLKVQEGLRSGTVGLVQRLHSAYPEAWAAEKLFVALASLDGDPARHEMHLRAATATEETRVRLVDALANRFLIWEGDDFEVYRRRVRGLVEAGEAKAARELAMDIIDGQWLFPVALKPKLLEDEEQSMLYGGQPMIDETARVETAMENVGSAIGADASYFAPPGEKRFDPMTVVITLGGVLLGAFAKGFVDRASVHAEKAGGLMADWLSERISQLYEQGQEVSGRVVDEVRSFVSAARGAAERSEPANVASLMQATESELMLSLRSYGLSELRANEIAAAVRAEASTLLAA